MAPLPTGTESEDFKDLLRDHRVAESQRTFVSATKSHKAKSKPRSASLQDRPGGFGLYRENPFRVWFEGHGFSEPKLDETRSIYSFKNEEHAAIVRRYLPRDHGSPCFIDTCARLRQRIRARQG